MSCRKNNTFTLKTMDGTQLFMLITDWDPSCFEYLNFLLSNLGNFENIIILVFRIFIQRIRSQWWPIHLPTINKPIAIGITRLGCFFSFSLLGVPPPCACVSRDRIRTSPWYCMMTGVLKVRLNGCWKRKDMVLNSVELYASICDPQQIK